MAKKTQQLQFGLRDWLLILLALAIVSINVFWYLNDQGLRITDRSDAESWLSQQVQIQKLKACIDNGIKPCDIKPQIQQ